MGIGIKTKIKKMFTQKELIPIVQTPVTDKEFDGKVALISGGTGGIGLSIARTLQQSGCKVIIAGTNEKKLNSLCEKTKLDGIAMNYSYPEKFDSVIQDVVQKFGRIDIFISSSGVHTESVDFWTMNPEEFDRVMAINLKGAFFACQSIGKYMRDANIRGSILLISSSRGSEPAWSPYGISKWGLKGMTQGLAKIFCQYGINVNAISPGSTATGLIGFQEGNSIASDENAMNRLIMPEEIANLAKLLVGDAGKMIDGEIIHISAGRGTFDIR